MRTHWILTLGLSWLLAFALGNGVLAQDQQELTQPKVPLEQLLNRDGTLDLNRGFHGSVDPAGWQMITGPSGEPRFVPVSAAQQTAEASQLMEVPGDENWDGRFYTNGSQGRVSALALDHSGNVYIAGYFAPEDDHIGAFFVDKWDGSNWLALGSGTNNYIYALAVDGNGNVYAGGDFTTAGGISANHIAMWDGRNWSAMGTGISSLYNTKVHALAVDGSGNVYAGGAFTAAGGVSANHIARWNGNSWSDLGSGVNGSVYALTVDGSGNVYAGGSFTSAGGATASGIAKWDGTSWSAIGSGMNSAVRSLAVDNHGNIYAGGEFTIAGDVGANRIAKWDGDSWSDLGTGMDDRVDALAVDGGGNLYAGGYFTTAGGASVKYVAKWNGSNWSDLGSDMNNSVYALAVDGTGNLYTVGYFWTVGGLSTNGIAKWNGSSWSTPFSDGAGIESYVSALAMDEYSNVYIGGSFTAAGDVSANHIAKWNGSSWSELGLGIGDHNSNVRALAVDGKGNVYAGGNFTSAGGVSANNIAKWDGSSWSTLGSGIMNSSVYALAVDGSGNVYAGGFFTMAGGVSANNIAKWNGSTWSALGSGTTRAVTTLTVDSKGNVYAGGAFPYAGNVHVHSIAKWNGSTWSALGSGMSGGSYNATVVNALAVDGNGNVYAGGNFTSAGGVSANYIAKWNGSSWSALGSGMGGGSYYEGSYHTAVSALIVDGGGNVYAGGNFTSAGGAGANNIAKWDGSSWSALGSGTSPNVLVLAVDGGGSFYAGGTFTRAGDKVSIFFGHYSLNRSPLADAGVNQTVITATGSAQITLNGSGSSDPDDDPLTYTWEENGNVIANSATSQVTLGVGIHTIELTVGDGKGGTASDVVIITVKSAEGAIDDLIAVINSLVLKNDGIKTSLTKKLSNAQESLRLGDNQTAFDLLNDFINEVTAQRGKALSEADADALIAQAQVIIAAINAASAPKVAFSATENGIVPNSYALEQNYPNPFNPVTTIQFSVPRASYVRLKVYNSLGVEVATLVDQHVAAGTYKVNWDASRLASGFYLYRLEAEGFAQTRKLLLMK